jgi:RsiW-degrading membrane proteinase PrsW (M82 family)
MAAMPMHDPVPRRAPAPDPAVRQQQLERAALAWAHYKRMMKWMALAAAVTVLLALAWLRSSGEPMPLHMVIATIAGVGLSVLVGTGLMGLVFLSSSSGHDDAASGKGGEQ